MFRLITENTRRYAIEKLVSQRFLACTYIDARGLMNGRETPSLIVEIDDAERLDVYNLAGEIARENDQQCVLVQEIDAKSCFIYQDERWEKL